MYSLAEGFAVYAKVDDGKDIASLPVGIVCADSKKDGGFAVL